MGIGLPQFIPASSTRGADQFLVVGLEGLEAYVIDQDGDLRTVNVTDLATKWRYHSTEEVWYSLQEELPEEDREE